MWLIHLLSSILKIPSFEEPQRVKVNRETCKVCVSFKTNVYFADTVISVGLALGGRLAYKTAISSFQPE